MNLYVKVLISVVVTVVVAWASRKSAAWGGWVTAFPISTLLMMAFMAGDRRPEPEMASYLSGVTFGLIPTLLLLLAWAMALRAGLSFSSSLGVALGVWTAVTLTARQFGVFG